METELYQDKVLQKVQESFGFSYIYPWQRMVIENILAASEEVKEAKTPDNEILGHQIVLLPTGAGKSLCFMAPALLLPGPTLILYPLLALMSDQERRMIEGGMTPVVFKGQQTSEERKRNFELLSEGAKIILANPEVLQSEQLVEKLKEFHISHIAIDEAHCVSEWGDSFRPAYLTLGTIIKKLEVPVVTAFTATASPEVLSRVSEVLFDGDAHLVRSESDRQNIHYFVKYADIKEKTLIETVAEEERPLIVFCSTRKRTRSTALLLQEFFSQQREEDVVRFYHAGLTKEEKKETDAWFHPKKDGILVTTCAWGMGVDKKDIHCVIHLDPPNTAEAYIQEAGRGGRDGSVAKAILLWSKEDDIKFAQFPPESRFAVLKNFATTRDCRRQVLLNALGGEEAACAGCDLCNRKREGLEPSPQISKESLDFIHHLKMKTTSLTKEEALDYFYLKWTKDCTKNFNLAFVERKQVQTLIESYIKAGVVTENKKWWKEKELLFLST